MMTPVNCISVRLMRTAPLSAVILTSILVAGCGAGGSEVAEDPADDDPTVTVVPYAVLDGEIRFGDKTFSTVSDGRLQSVGAVAGGGFVYSTWDGALRPGTEEGDPTRARAQVVHVGAGDDRIVLSERLTGVPISEPGSPLVAWTEYETNRVRLVVWDAASGERTTAALTSDEARVTAVSGTEVVTVDSLSPDQSSPATSTIWRISHGSVDKVTTMKGFVTDLDQAWVVVSMLNESMRVVDRATGGVAASLPGGLVGALSPDGSHLAVNTSDGLGVVDLTAEDPQADDLTNTPAAVFAVAWTTPTELTATMFDQANRASVLLCDLDSCAEEIEPTPTEGGIPVGTQFSGQFWSTYAG